MDKKIIIGFTGSHATGKTTMAKEFLREYPDGIEVCTEGTREVATEMRIESIKNIKPHQWQEFEDLILEHHLQNIHKFNTSDKEILICDRTIFDIYAYSILRNNFLSQNYLNTLDKMCKETTFYKQLWYFPIIPIPDKDKDDGFREIKNQKQIDAILKGILVNSPYGYPVNLVPRGNRPLEERKQYIEYVLQFHLNAVRLKK